VVRVEVREGEGVEAVALAQWGVMPRTQQVEMAVIQLFKALLKATVQADGEQAGGMG
jgi:hypothetical protein